MKKLLSTASMLAFLSISTFSTQNALAIGTAQEERLVTDMVRRASLPLMTGAMTMENLMGPLIAHTLSKAQIQGGTTVLSDAVRMRFSETDVFLPGTAAKVTATEFKVVTPGSSTPRADVEVLTTEFSFPRKPTSMDVSFEITGGYKITTTLTVPNDVLTPSARQYMAVCTAEIGDTVKLVATSDVKMPSAIKDALQEVLLLKNAVDNATLRIKELDTKLSAATSDLTTEKSRSFTTLTKMDTDLQAAQASLKVITGERDDLVTKLSKLATEKAKVDADLLAVQTAVTTLTSEKAKVDADLLLAQTAVTTLTSDKSKLEADLLAAQGTGSTLTADKSKLEADLRAAQSAVTTLTSDKSKLEADLLAAQTAVTTLTSDKSKLEADLLAARTAVTTLTSDKSKLEADLLAAQTAVTTLTSDKSKLEANLLAAQGTGSTLTADKSKLEADLRAAQSAFVTEKADLAAQLSKAQAASEELRQQLAQTRGSMEQQASVQGQLEEMRGALRMANFFDSLPGMIDLASAILASEPPRDASDDDDARFKWTHEKMAFINQALSKASQQGASMQEELPWPAPAKASYVSHRDHKEG